MLNGQERTALLHQLLSDKHPTICGGGYASEQDKRRCQTYDAATDNWAFVATNAAGGGWVRQLVAIMQIILITTSTLQNSPNVGLQSPCWSHSCRRIRPDLMEYEHQSWSWEKHWNSNKYPFPILLQRHNKDIWWLRGNRKQDNYLCGRGSWWVKFFEHIDSTRPPKMTFKLFCEFCSFLA